MARDFDRLMDQFCDQERIHRFEGETGFANLAKVVEGIGYKDPHYYGTLSNGASIGSLMNFFIDNPGAMVAVHDWILEFGDGCTEWQEELASRVESGDDDDQSDEE